MASGKTARSSAIALVLLFSGLLQVQKITSLELKNSAYEDLVITVGDAVPVKNCKAVLANLEATLTSASQFLFSALDGRAFLRSATVILPQSWPESCVSKPVVSGTGEVPDVSIVPSGPSRGKLWTQQSAGCYQPGDQIYIGYESLERRDTTLGRLFVKEFAKYRYGVFDEQGYANDPIYPMCYHDDHTKTAKVTGCSELPLTDNGICTGKSTDFNISRIVDDKARSSIMFAVEAPAVSMFCDIGTHERYAPTKHNFICRHKSTLEIVRAHKDFSNNQNTHHQSGQIQNTTPKITYKKYNTTRFVLVIENTKDMLQRESWRFLRTAVRKWIMNDLPETVNAEVGLVLTNETGAVKLLPVTPMKGYNQRDALPSSIPYTPGEFGQTPCLHCALKEGLEMLNERTKNYGPASNAIVVIAPGMNTNANVQNLLKEANKSRVKITTINYPEVIRTQTLDILAEGTGGRAYTITEQRVNVENSLLTTYFQLSNILYNILETYLSPTTNLPMEIHRRIIKNDGRSSITGTFVLDKNMGEPARFMLYTHNIESPLIKSITLTSPNQEVYTRRSDSMLTAKIVTLNANITEPGTWTYTIEPFIGNPQPHVLQVMATPKLKSSPVVKARFWIKRYSAESPLILFCEVKKGDFPVWGAKVEVWVTKSESNGSSDYKETFELLDTGSGDPDITKYDGIYTRYFNAVAGGPGIYSFQVTVTDNGNSAFIGTEGSRPDNKPCCGSLIPITNGKRINPFQRVLPPITIEISSHEIISASSVPAGRIGDLHVEIIQEDMKARLIWSAPDMGGHEVSRYEIRYANNVDEIVEKFDTNAAVWEGRSQPLPLSAGSESTFYIDMSQNRDLLDKPFYFAIRAFAQSSSESKSSPASNWVRVLVPSPPPPPTVAPTYTTNDSPWPFHKSSPGSDNAGPSISKNMGFGLEIILPIVIGIILLIVLLVLYCYFCVVKRRTRGNHKKPTKEDQIKADKINSNITIVPSSPINMPQENTHTETYSNDYPDHHTIGVPVNNYGYEDETKKRYSLVHHQEQQLIEELKQQQMQRDQMNTPNNNYGGLSVISNNTLQRNGHTLSPYNSWSASQLLNEHDRRHSPMENMMQDEQQMLTQHQDALSQLDHMSINGQTPEHIINGHQVPEHYVQGHIPPPVPPLPAFNQNGYPANYGIYGVHQPQPHPIYQSMPRNDPAYTTSLQGSMTSVNSGEKKRRNVTMV